MFHKLDWLHDPTANEHRGIRQLREFRLPSKHRGEGDPELLRKVKVSVMERTWVAPFLIRHNPAFIVAQSTLISHSGKRITPR